MRHILLRMASFCYLWPQLQGASFNYHQSTGHLPLAAIGKGRFFPIMPKGYRQLFTRFTGCTDSKDLSLDHSKAISLCRIAAITQIHNNVVFPIAGYTDSSTATGSRAFFVTRSEERRVGKECRSRRSQNHCK